MWAVSLAAVLAFLASNLFDEHKKSIIDQAMQWASSPEATGMPGAFAKPSGEPEQNAVSVTAGFSRVS